MSERTAAVRRSGRNKTGLQEAEPQYRPSISLADLAVHSGMAAGDQNDAVNTAQT